MGALVGVGVDMVLGVGMLMGALIGVELDVISGVYCNDVTPTILDDIGTIIDIIIDINTCDKGLTHDTHEKT